MLGKIQESGTQPRAEVSQQPGRQGKALALGKAARKAPGPKHSGSGSFSRRIKASGAGTGGINEARGARGMARMD